MKKFLSFILVAAMLLSMIIVVSVPTAAADGDWTTYASPDAYGEEDDGTPKTPVVPGYEYTDEGFTTVDADWTNRSPWFTVQTKNPVSLEDGIYLLVRIDEYAYEGNDAWINLSLWDSQMIKPGSAGYGQGLQTLIRPYRDNDQSEDWYYDKVQWWVREWQLAGTTTIRDAEGRDAKTPVVDGQVTFELELKYENGAYSLTINGAPAPDTTMNLMNRLFPNGEAYVGITVHNSTYDSNAGLTILKFGTSKEDAVTPDGDDYKEPLNAEVTEVAEIADPSTVPAGMPAIFMNGDKENSDTKKVGAGQGDTFTVEDDFSVRVVDTNGDRWNSNSFSVKNEVSYDIDDFPVLCFLTRNFCTCDDPEDCYATETCGVYIMAGNGKAPASGGCQKTPPIDVCWDPVIVEEGEMAGNYLYFWYDTSSENALAFAGGEGSKSDWTGRIHGAQLEFSGLSTDPARGIIPIVWVAFFRSVEEAEAYVLSYLGVNEEGGDTTTEAPVGGDVTTEAPVGGDTTTEAPKGDATTEAKGENKTEAPKGEEKTEAKGENKTEDPAASSGCGGVIGAGAVAVVAIVSLGGAVVLRKKED